MTGEGQVLSLGSFSKIMAPGLRLGWIQTSPNLMEKLMDNGAINSGGSLNHFTSHIMRQAIELGNVAPTARKAHRIRQCVDFAAKTAVAFKRHVINTLAIRALQGRGSSLFDV